MESCSQTTIRYLRRLPLESNKVPITNTDWVEEWYEIRKDGSYRTITFFKDGRGESSSDPKGSYAGLMIVELYQQGVVNFTVERFNFFYNLYKPT